MNQISMNDIKIKLRRIFTKKRVLIGSAIIAAFLIITPIATYAYYARDISDRERLINRNSTGIILKDKDGKVFYEYGRLNGKDDVTLSQIADPLEHAVIASEDKEFYKHEGYSVRGIAMALYGDIRSGDPTKYGGSTITQQLVKNKLFTNDKNFLRKYQEISMAVAVERQYTKDEILEMYLNSVYFGEGAFGIADASETYFDKAPSELNVAESAMLIGLLPAPSAYSPVSGDAELAKREQERVLDAMAENNYIAADEKDAELERKLAYAPPAEQSFSSAQHYTLMVLDELKKEYSEEQIIRQGFEVTTGLDLDWQKKAEETVRTRVQEFSGQGGRNAGLVTIDPNNGEVRALVGSVDWENETFGKVNMAMSMRQPGSSFKPIYYSEALEQKIITPATILHDKPTTFGNTYRPENYDFRYRGDITARNALAQSLNIPAVEVMQKLGVYESADAAEKMNITTVTEPDKYGLSLALGTAEVKLYEMTNAYAAFANEGEQYKPVLVKKVEDKFNNVLFEQEEQDARKVRSPESAYLISSILSDATARAPLYGSRLNITGKKVAFKTGTTNDNRDAWTIGYTPNVVTGVWVGNNENEPMSGLAGGSSAGVIWRDTMTEYLDDVPNSNFVAPKDIVRLQVCRGSGLRAIRGGGNTYSEYFIKGTEPSQTCNQAQPKREVQEDNRRGHEEKKEDKKEDKKKVEEEIPIEDDNNTNEGEGEEGGRGGGEEPPPEEWEEEPTFEDEEFEPERQQRRGRPAPDFE